MFTCQMWIGESFWCPDPYSTAVCVQPCDGNSDFLWFEAMYNCMLQLCNFILYVFEQFVLGNIHLCVDNAGITVTTREAGTSMCM